MEVDVLWTSKNGLWEIGKRGFDGGMRWYIEDTTTGCSDNPVVYDDGRVGFDDPYFLPKYVKKQFKILANKEMKGNRSKISPKARNSNAEESSAMKEVRADSAFESMLYQKTEINRLLNQPFFKIAVTENMDNPEVERIVGEMIDIANEDFISTSDSKVTDLLLDLDDHIPLLYKTMREIMLEKYR